jgi:hypothetical protein
MLPTNPLLSRRALLFAGSTAPALLRATMQSTPPGASWTDAEKENMLRKGVIVAAKNIDIGVTHPVRVTLKEGEWTHDASVQRVNAPLPIFFGADGSHIPMTDSWRYNVAGYKVDRLIGLDMVAVTVQRPYLNKPGSMSWWVDDVLMDETARRSKHIEPPNPEAFFNQIANSKVFDELIINIDRNLSNLLITKSWDVALIDHTRCFVAYPKIRNTENLTKCGTKLLQGMKALDSAKIKQSTAPLLTQTEIDATLSRRDAIVLFFEQLAKEKGSNAVYF